MKVVKTLTGFKFIGDKIHTYNALGSHTYIFGYEESYGYLLADFARDKDAVQASLMLCEAAAYYKSQGKTLYDVLMEIYEEYGYYLDSLTNVVHKGAAGAKKIAALMENLRAKCPDEIGGVAVTKMEDFLSAELVAQGFPPSDVLRYELADGSFVAVRPSGTEPKCKYYYCVAAANRAEAEEKLARLRADIEG